MKPFFTLVEDLLSISGLSSASPHVAKGVVTIFTVRVGAGLSGNDDVEDLGNHIDNVVVVGADKGRNETVLNCCVAELTFESLEVAVLAYRYTSYILPSILKIN